jgi:hypothetical protein
MNFETIGISLLVLILVSILIGFFLARKIQDLIKRKNISFGLGVLTVSFLATLDLAKYKFIGRGYEGVAYLPFSLILTLGILYYFLSTLFNFKNLSRQNYIYFIVVLFETMLTLYLIGFV